MLNSIGLANIGVHNFISEKLPVLKKYDTKIIANIAASSVQEYCDVLELLDLQEGVHGFEINVSCQILILKSETHHKCVCTRLDRNVATRRHPILHRLKS